MDNYIINESTQKTGRIKALFSGRLGRLGYFGRCVALNIALNLIYLTMDVLPAETMTTILFLILYAFFIIIIIFCLFSIILITVRRFHDISLSGWWTLYLVFPLIWGISEELNLPTLLLVTKTLSIICGFIVLFAPGTKGPNRYDADYGRTSTDAKLLKEL